MALYKVDSDTADLTKVAGGTLYADAPIGTILAYGGIAAPSGWLLCQGQLLNVEDYPELYAVIGTNFDRNNTIQAGKFRVPDARECVLVGYSQNNTYSDIVEHDTYQLGQFKDDQLQEHGHTFQQEGGLPPSGVPINSKIIFGGSQTSAQYNTAAIKKTSVIDARTGTTTHGKQLGVNYIIKAKQVAVPADFMDAIDDAMNSVDFATIVSGTANVSIGDHICSKNIKNVCAMIKGHTNGIVLPSTKICSGFFIPLTPNTYAYLDIPFAIRNRTTNVTEMRMGYLDTNGDFYTSAYTENIESDWDIQLFFSYLTD